MFKKALCVIFLASTVMPTLAAAHPLSVNGAFVSGDCQGFSPTMASAAGDRVVIGFDPFRISGPFGSPLGASAFCDIFLDISTSPGFTAALLSTRYQGTFLSVSTPFNPGGPSTFARRMSISNGSGVIQGPIRTNTYPVSALLSESDVAEEFRTLAPAEGFHHIEIRIDITALGEGSVISLSGIELEFAVFNPFGVLASE